MKTVLIFAHECAPFQRPQSMVGAQRPAQFAKHLGAFGWRAVVLCCDNARRGRHDREAALDEAREDARRALAAAQPGAPVIIATPSLSHDGLIDRVWRSSQSVAPLRKALTLAKFLSGDWSQSWQPCARAAAEAVAREVNIDACLGEHGPDAGIFLARWFHEKYGTPWLADFRDPLPHGFQGLARRLYAATGRRLVKTAAAAINVAPHWAELDHELLGRPVHCITNGYDPEEFLPPAVERSEFCAIIYAGNIIPSQRLEIFLAGLREAGDPRLRFIYHGGAHQAVARLAAQERVSGQCDITPAIPREASLAQLARAQILLLLSVAEPERGDPYFVRGFYPAKTFEYFGARRPILCVPGDGGLLDELLAETRAGEVAHTPAQVAAYLTQAAEAWAAGQDLNYSPDDHKIAQYTRRHLTGRLASLLDEITAAAGPRA